MPSLRPNHWKPDPAVQKNTDEKLQNQRLRAAVERIQASLEQSQAKTPSGHKPATFTITSAVLSTTEQYPLHDSFILDSGADVHVRNNYDRFTTYREASDTDFLFAGDQQVPISGYGTVSLRLQCLEGAIAVALCVAVFIPSFHTSVVSLRRMIAKGVHWKTELSALYYDDSLFATVTEAHNQYVLEYNPHSDFVTNSHLPRGESYKTIAIWHQQMGHLSHEAHSHLPASTKGVSFKEGRAAPTDICEPCRISKATQIISRRPSDRANKFA
jgi:hypothetical protein